MELPPSRLHKAKLEVRLVLEGIPTEVAEMIKTLAAEDRRPVSQFLANLVEDAIAKRTESLPDSDFITHAFLSLLSRAPTPDERAACAGSLAYA